MNKLLVQTYYREVFELVPKVFYFEKWFLGITIYRAAFFPDTVFEFLLFQKALRLKFALSWRPLKHIGYGLL